MVTDKQVKRLFKLRSMGMTKSELADKTNMDIKTVSKYLDSGKLPSQIKPEHNWQTRKDSFEDAWEYIKDLLGNNPGLEAKTIFEHLQEQNPGNYQDGQLRTLQRRIKQWRAIEGPNKEIFFDQIHHPGKLCASDFTDMNELNITISGQQFNHKLYHFILTYSNWEAGTVCFSESLESLSEGLQNALWELGRVPREHRTDRLSAAINNLSNSKEFTQRYKEILDHYNIRGQKTQPYSPHENGDIEQSNYRFKKAIDQALMLRGSRNFNSRDDYEKFLKDKFNQINSNRLDKLTEEMKHLRELPLRRIEDYREFSVKVSPGSTIRINNNTYSVHSRLIKEHVKVLLYADHLKVYYGQSLIEEIPRLVGDNKNHIQYRHIIDSLIRKPGAFEDYKYKNDMFPTSHFKITFDLLKEQNPVNANKEYLKILNLAAKESEDQVDKALMISIDAGDDISFTGIEKIVLSESACDFSFPIEISSPVDLELYDALLEEAI
jgi:transcriptional regulator with XRE-family HTH domain